MSYKTDMMEKIITSQEAQTIIEYLSPIYGQSYVGLWMLQVIGMQLDKSSQWTAELALQVTPQSATWTIEFWEKEYNIIPVDGWTLQQRRDNILSKMRSLAPMTPKTLENVVSGAAGGVPVEILENTGKNTFTVLVRQYTEYFDRGREALEEAKPAHLIYVMKMALLIKMNLNVYTGIGTSTRETFNIKVVQ